MAGKTVGACNKRMGIVLSHFRKKNKESKPVGNRGCLLNSSHKLNCVWVGTTALRRFTLKIFCKLLIYNGLWCNGSTTDFGSVSFGSNPDNPTNTARSLRYEFESYKEPY